jgi:hypothetical protein
LGQATLEITKQSSEQEWYATHVEDDEEPQVEAQVFDFEEYRKRRVGREAIRISAEELGYNDALTYLYRYLDNGSSDYMIDFESEIAERLKKSNHFENHVFFKPVGSDFVTLRDGVSLTESTSKSLPMLQEESARRPALKDEYERAKLESSEIGIISEWFNGAEEGDFLVFESLPLVYGEDQAVTRVYQRVGNLLEGCYFSLNNPDVNQFNELRKKLGVTHTESQTAVEFLAKPYEISDDLQLATTSDFVDHYVGVYDHLLSMKNHKYYNFGFEVSEGSQNQNSFEKVKSQKRLLSVFSKTVEALANSNGKATTEIAKICQDFEISGLGKGQPISSGKAREILMAVSLGIVSSIAKIDQKTLQKLEGSDGNTEANYDAVVYGSSEANANEETYDSLCPTFEVTASQSASQTGSENSAILQAYGYHGKLSNFGKPKIDVCRITNCPSRGESRYVPNKTLVGGCEICVHCHKLFEKGKSPEKVYIEEKKKFTEEENKKEELIAQQNKMRLSDQLEVARKRKCLEQEKQRFNVKTDERVKKAA